MELSSAAWLLPVPKSAASGGSGPCSKLGRERHRLTPLDQSPLKWPRKVILTNDIFSGYLGSRHKSLSPCHAPGLSASDCIRCSRSPALHEASLSPSFGQRQ